MKKRGYILIITLFIIGQIFAQDDRYKNTFVCTRGKAHFFSKTPVEDIEATTYKAACVLNTETRKVSVKIPIISFKFANGLMEQHFNENYMETDKYPSAVLDAVITNSDIDFSKDGYYDVELRGSLEIHGVKQERVIYGKLVVMNGQVSSATANFDVKLVDHKIEVPKLVFANIAEVIKVDVEFVFQRYQKAN